MRDLIIYLIGINVVTFFVYGIDKWKARRGKWRIPEDTLIWLAIAGDRLLAPYFCMGLIMLSILTDDGPITVNEADYVVIGENGEISIE